MIAEQRESPEMTLKMIQCGSISLSKKIECGIFLLGDTKVGKTTSAHYLTQATLQGIQDAVQGSKYKVSQCDQKNRLYNIGLTRNSETQIPNEFSLAGFTDINIAKDKISLFDCPGYSDSYGCGRIISNAYFHLRLFSKVQKIKFVLVFSFDEMKGKAEPFTQTFLNFIEGFSPNQFEKEYKNIFAATSVMITKVPRNIDKQGLQNIFKSVPFAKKKKLLKEYFEAMKAQVIKKQRLFYMHAAQVGQFLNTNTKNQIVVKIHERSDFWERKMINDKEPDMSMIKTNIQELLMKTFQDDDDFREDFEKFGQYYQQNFIRKLTLLQNVLKLFIQDTFEPSQDGKMRYIQAIRKNFEEQQDRMKKLRRIVIDGAQVQNPIYTMDRLYSVKKEEIRSTIYANAMENSISSTNHSPAWLKRIRVAEIISQFADITDEDQGYDIRKTQTLINASQKVKQIIEEMIGLNRDVITRDLMKKFAYEVHEIFEISNAFYRIMKNPQNDNNINTIAHENPLNIIIVKYPTKILDVAAQIFQLDDINERKVRHFQRIKNKKLGESAEEIRLIIQYLDSLEQIIKETDNNQVILEEIAVMKNDLILNQSQNSLRRINRNAPNHEQVKNIIKNLQEIRRDLEVKISDNNISVFESQVSIFQTIKMFELMAECLILEDQEYAAIGIWEKIFMADEIFQLMDKIQKRKQATFRTDLNGRFQFLSKYMNLARRLGRFEVSMKKAHQALSAAFKLKQLSKVNEVRTFMKTIISTEEKIEMVSPEYYQDFSNWLQTGRFDLKLPVEVTLVIDRFVSQP